MSNLHARWALDRLQESVDGYIYHDHGRQIQMLARQAGVQVRVIHVNLATYEVRYYTVDKDGKRV